MNQKSVCADRKKSPSSKQLITGYQNVMCRGTAEWIATFALRASFAWFASKPQDGIGGAFRARPIGP